MALPQHDDGWAPRSCTLPSAQRPLRRDEFDALFSTYVVGAQRESAQRLRLDLRPDPEAASLAARLAVLESECCSFFRFQLTVGEGATSLSIDAPPDYAHVVDALAVRAEGRVRADT